MWGNWGIPADYNNLIFGFAADQGDGVPYANYWDTTLNPYISAGNATDISDFTQGGIILDTTTDITHDGGISRGPFYSHSFGGYNSTCGPSNNPCTGLNASDVFVNATVGPSF